MTLANFEYLKHQKYLLKHNPLIKLILRSLATDNSLMTEKEKSDKSFPMVALMKCNFIKKTSRDAELFNETDAKQQNILQLSDTKQKYGLFCFIFCIVML